MCDRNAFWLSLILNLLFQVDSRATIYLKLLSLKVEGNDRFCDTGLTSSACDLYLKICLRRDSKEGCDLYIVTPRRAFIDQNSIIFGKKIKYIENPLSVNVLEFPSTPQLSIEIYDADFGIFDTDDHLATLKQENMTIPTIPSFYASENFTDSVIPHDGVPVTLLSHHVGTSAIIQLRFSIWAVCSQSFYGPKCEVQCKAQHSDELGHFGCDLVTGEKICMPGWYGKSCNRLDLCATKDPCGSMGNCLNSAEGFHCVCKPPFFGPFCTQLPNRCQSDGLLTGGTQGFPFCLNDAFCVIQPNHETDGNKPQEAEHHPAPLCICLPGFTGTRCERDIDECALGTRANQLGFDSNLTESLQLELMARHGGPVKCLTPGHVAQPCCGPQAQCVNTYGGYRCVCPSGWTGLHCEYPPTAWPNGYHPLLNWTDEVALAESAQLDLHLFNSGLKDVAGSGNTTTVWTNAFVALLVVFLIMVLFILIYMFVLRRRRRHTDPKFGNIPSVRYERPIMSVGLPLIPARPDAQSTMTQNTAYRPSLIYEPSGTGVSTLEEDVTDYEELPGNPCYAPPFDDLTAMYDLLDDDTNQVRLPTVQSNKDMRTPFTSFFDQNAPAEKHTQSLLLSPSALTDCSNVLYLEPRMLMQPDGSEELLDSPRGRKSNQSC